MDEVVKRACACLLFAFAFGCSGLVSAQALQDPTRPPANLIARQPGDAAAGAAAAPVKAAPRLQSVLIARQPGGRHVAVIDGETLRLGDSYKGARVTRIEQNEVELSRGKTRQVLTLNAAAPAGSGGIERVRQ
jgi:MSHA biogenesis protein MshK